MESVIVTGAGSGIGAACARDLAKAGYFVVLVGRTESKLTDVASQIGQKNCLTLSTDLSSAEGCSYLFEALKSSTASQYPLKALVNNAGIVIRKPFIETSDEEWESHFQINLMSVVRLSKEAVPLLKQNPSSPSIINISSNLGLKPIADTSSYSAVKAALINLTQSMALEFSAYKIRVNCIAPGIVETPIHHFYKTEDSKLRNQLDRLQPLGRMGQPVDIAKAVTFLVSDQSSWTTGSVLTIDGGISLL